MTASSPMDDLCDDHCRWIDGDPRQGEWSFCRKPRARYTNGTYRQGCWCEEHRRRALLTGKQYAEMKVAA